jgi:hypothetical protein
MLVRLTVRPGESDPERLWLVVLGLSGLIAAAWCLLPHPAPACPFHTLTGLPCLTCGGTRCIRSLLAGQTGTAFAWNPLVFLAAIAGVGFVLYAALVTTFQLPRLRLAPLTPAGLWTVRIGLLAALATNWLYLILRFSRAG